MSLLLARNHAKAAYEALDALLAAKEDIPKASAWRIDKFYTYLRTTNVLGPSISTDEAKGSESILKAAEGVLPLPWAAYALATAWHETGGVMVPNVENLNYTTAERIRAVWPSRFPTVASARPFVRNAKGLANKVYNGRLGNRLNTDDGWNFRGRGQAHITGRENYERADRILELNGALINNPDLATQPDIASKILVTGMKDGWFTGKKFNDYINNSATEAQFSNARLIINPDRNGPAIAKVAVVFKEALKAGDWQ